MPGKKFISKKNAVTFRLVPRCQLDPDADSSEHVLVPVDEAKHNKFDIMLPACALPPVKEPPKSKKQIPEMGSQHKWDPDIIAALDDFDDADALEDNFVAMANGCVGETQAFNKLENGSENGDGDSLDSDDEWFSGSVGDEKEKPKHTQYSLTNCSEDIQILNERFEKFCEAYDDDQIGALDFEEIDGYHDPLKDTVEGRKACFVDYKKKLDPYENGLDEQLKQKTLLYADTSGDEESDSEEEVTEEDPKYDCESIISTYSNKHNRPVLIKVEKKEKPVSKISANLWKQTLTKSNLRKVGREADDEEDDVESIVSENETIVSTCIRPKNETSEEKRQRKQAVKEIKRENRMFKKENKLAFKEEKKKRSSAMLNTNRNRVVRLPC